MKKRWKIFWITCIIAAAVGFVCCLAALGLGVTRESVAGQFPYGIGFVGKNTGWHEREIYSGSADSVELLENQDIHEIDVQLSGGDFQILESDTDTIRLETSNISSKLKFNYYVEDGELVIETRGGLRKNGQGTVYLFLPKGYELNEASIEVGAGNLYIADISAGSLDVEVGAGKGEIKNYRAGEADFKCGAGLLTLSGRPEWELNVECEIGEIIANVEGSQNDYSYYIKFGVGEVNVGEARYTGLGYKETIRHNTGKEMSIDCGIGRVTVNFSNSN